MKLYLGFDWSQKRRRENKYPYCFLSSAVCYSYTEGKSLPAWKINNAKEIILDSGGFSLLNKYGDYPYSIDEYVKWIKEMNKINEGKVILAAIRDYPCEPEITRKLGLMTNADRIKKTVEQTKLCMKQDISPVRWMPVLQGYMCQDYLTCLQLLKDEGVLTDYIAIGSMCKRKQILDIRQILERIKRGYSGKIHLFGLTQRAIKDKSIFYNVDSCDSLTYSYRCDTMAQTFDRMNLMLDNHKVLCENHKKQSVLHTIEG